MKKIIVGFLTLSLVVGTTTLVFANNDDDTTLKSRILGPKTMMNQARENRPNFEISEQQREKMQSIFKQNLALRKEILQDNVDKGIITEEKLQLMEERMEKMAELRASGTVPFSRGVRLKVRDTDNLTEEQLQQLEEKMATFKELKAFGEFEGRFKRGFKQK